MQYYSGDFILWYSGFVRLLDFLNSLFLDWDPTITTMKTRKATEEQALLKKHISRASSFNDTQRKKSVCQYLLLWIQKSQFVEIEPFVAVFRKYKKDLSENKKRTFMKNSYQYSKQHREIMDLLEIEQKLFSIPTTLGIIFNFFDLFYQLYSVLKMKYTAK